MIDDILENFKVESKKYSKEHYKSVKRTGDFIVYFWSTLLFIPSFLIAQYVVLHTNNIFYIVFWLSIILLLLMLSILFEKKSNKNFFVYHKKKDIYLKEILQKYLRDEYSLSEAEQFRHLSSIIVKKIDSKKSYYNFNPTYVSIMLTTLLTIAKASEVKDISLFMLVILTILAFSIIHFVLRMYTNYRNDSLNAFEEINRLLNEILLEKLSRNSGAKKKIRSI